MAKKGGGGMAVVAWPHELVTDQKPYSTALVAAAKKVLDNDPMRLAVVLSNVGAQDVWVWFDDTVSSTKGILIPAASRPVVLSFRDMVNMQTRALWAISNATGSTLFTVTEYIVG